MAWLVIGEFFVVNLISAFTSTDGGIAFAAHIGGFVAGLVLMPLLRVQQKVEYEPWEGWRSAD